MKRRQVFVAFAALVLAIPAVLAQQKPNFAGTWVIVSPAEAAGQEETYRQDANTLTNSHDSEGGGHSFTYRFDGVETRSTIGSDVVTLSKAGWEGEKLIVTSTTTYGDGRKLESKKVFSLDDKGQLVVNLTQTMSGRPTETVTVVYRKK